MPNRRGKTPRLGRNRARSVSTGIIKWDTCVRWKTTRKEEHENDETTTTDEPPKKQKELPNGSQNQPQEHQGEAHEGRLEDLKQMGCTRPINAYKGPGGVVFNSRQGYSRLQLKCGQCIGCRIDKARAWTIRLVHEGQMHASSCFVTLTYDDEHLPEDGSLVKKHFQNFAKKVRRDVGKFSYYHVGEYGPKTLRPHYHACIFGQDFRLPELPWVPFDRRGYMYRSPVLEQLWTKGNSTIGPFNEQTAAYCARYVISKATGPKADTEYQRVNLETGEVHQVVPEYATMSRNPAIGKRWLDKYSTDVYPSDDIVHDNKHFRPPVYYDRILEKDDPDLLTKLKEQRQQHVRQRLPDLTPSRMRTKERLQAAKAKTFQKHQL